MNQSSPARISTRSTTAGNIASVMSGKSTKSASSSSGLLTLDVFNNTMAEHQRTQKETLAQCKRLSESQNAQFSELNENLGRLSSQVVELKSENDKLQKIISSLSNRVQDLESANNSRRISSADTFPSIFHEFSERERCSRNVIIRGAQESSSSVLEDRVSNDTLKITEAIKPYFPELPSDFKAIRLGKTSDRGPRPLKVFFQSKEIAQKLVSDYNTNIRSSHTDNMRHPISVTRDRTPCEREAIRRVYTDLENRKKNGESDLVIKYRDGHPYIVPARRSSQDRRHQTSNSAVTQSKN